MKKNDILLISAILVFSAMLFFASSGLFADGDRVEIYKNNELKYSLPLSVDKEIDLGGKNKVVIGDGKVYMESADCPDQICVHQAPLGKSGRDIICLPNRVMVRVTKTADAPDAVSR